MAVGDEGVIVLGSEVMMVMIGVIMTMAELIVVREGWKERCSAMQ